MEHIIELTEEVTRQLMEGEFKGKQRAPFKRFSLTFTNSIFNTKEKVVQDVIKGVKEKTGGMPINAEELKRLDVLAEKYVNGKCTLKVTCYDTSETLNFKAHLLDPLNATLMKFTYNEFSKVPLVTALALGKVISGIIEYLNAPSQVIAKRQVKEPVVVKGNKKKKKKNKTTYINKCYYKIDNVPMSTKRTYERHTQAWTTRGHWRTYKSGKKVWIKEQVRGRGKDMAETKSYKINKLDI